jgi:hypothetical protein
MELSKRTAIYQALWKKAAQKPEGQCIEIPCNTANDAMKIRLDMYNAVKAARHNPHFDPELFDATQNCSVWYKGEDKRIVCVGRRKINPGLMAALAAEGIDISDLQPSPQTEEEKAAQDSLERLKQRQATQDDGHAPLTRKNPYYDRNT